MNVILTQAALGVILAVILGTHAVAVSEIFPTRVRQGGLSIGYNFTGAIFAGTVPYLMTYLIWETGNASVPAFYLMIVGIVAALTMKETVGKSLLDSRDLASNGSVTPSTAVTVDNV